VSAGDTAYSANLNRSVVRPLDKTSPRATMLLMTTFSKNIWSKKYSTISTYDTATENTNSLTV